MATLNFFLLPLLSVFSLLHLVFSQNPSGFISYDCGLPESFSYIEPTTGIKYDSDAAIINTGTIHNISSDIIKTGLNQQLWSLRSFPEGIRNCYKLKVVTGTKYLIRASFFYGNYDSRRQSPGFELYFGANLWDSVAFDDEMGTSAVHKEIIHIVSSSNIQVCVVNIGSGNPFVSALELRPLSNSAYETGNRSLAKVQRLDYGSVNNQTFRYKDDVYDRIWDPQPPNAAWTSISTSEQVDVNIKTLQMLPAPAVMKTAATPKNVTAPLRFTWLPPDTTASYFFYFYFAEIQKLEGNQSRAFDMFMNGKSWYDSTISNDYLSMTIIYSTSPWIKSAFGFSIIKTPNSTLPPILNAFEVYEVINFSQSDTNQEDVEAISNIKIRYGITRNWQGDPCVPIKFLWQGINCISVPSEPPRITSLNLSSNGLTGEIGQNIANLKMLEILDLSNNSLTGAVPEFLTQLPSLRVLNLERNNFNGLIPSQLIEKSKNGSLSLSFGENPNLFETAPNEEKENHIIIPIVASIGGFVLLSLLVAAAIFWRTKRNKQGDLKQNYGQSQQWEMTKRHYSYSEILRITNNFERLLGQGGFGRVYYGRIETTEVAVKTLSPQSTQGYQQFQTEVDLLMRVHHKNLIGLVGYCNESNYKGLIYEYMSRGNLGSLMSGGKSYLLNWENRLHIAVDVAHGLEYLHHSIRPAIVHRDVKSSNILLDDNFQAKISDFGLSRNFPNEGGVTHVTTNVDGTLGYLDPEYYLSYRLNEKSDVYGFGIVLLEIITGKPVLTKTQDTYLFQWVESMISQGDISSIIDPKLEEDFDVNSIWKAVDIAMSCASSNSAKRPNMNQVVGELNECLAMELSHNKENQLETVGIVEIHYSRNN